MPAEFRKKLQQLRYLEFQGHDRHDWLTMDISDDDLISELHRIPRPDLYLGRFSEDEIKEKLAGHGIISKLRALGFENIEIEIRTDEVYTHWLYVYTEKRDYDHILIELRLREGIFQPREQFIPDLEIGPLPMVMVDWLMLQNPTRDFEGGRPALLQQRHPRLGILHDLIPIIIESAGETGRAGVLDTPEHYHGALFYSRWFRFFNPEMEGRFLAMQRDLSGYPLHQISSCVYHDCLLDAKTGEYEKWSPGEQILPISDLLVKYFKHRTYAGIRDQAFLSRRYELDLARCEQRTREEEAGGNSRSG